MVTHQHFVNELRGGRNAKMEHFLHFIDISLLKCFSSAKENAHNLAITWFR